MNRTSFKKNVVWINIGDLVDFSGIQRGLIKVRPFLASGYPISCGVAADTP